MIFSFQKIPNSEFDFISLTLLSPQFPLECKNEWKMKESSSTHSHCTNAIICSSSSKSSHRCAQGGGRRCKIPVPLTSKCRCKAGVKALGKIWAVKNLEFSFYTYSLKYVWNLLLNTVFAPKNRGQWHPLGLLYLNFWACTPVKAVKDNSRVRDWERLFSCHRFQPFEFWPFR